jgi:hypothetical protein
MGATQSSVGGGVFAYASEFMYEGDSVLLEGAKAP